MERCEMIFSDVDGTLLNPQHRVPEETAARVRQLGIPLVPVSARMPAGIRPVLAQLRAVAPMICYSGALVLDEEEAVLHSVGITIEEALAVERYAAAHLAGICTSFYGHDQWVVTDPANPWIVQERDITGAFPLAGPLADRLERPEVHKLLCMGEPAPIAALDRALHEHFPALSIYRSKDTYLEIMHGAASKSAAIGVLCGLRGIPVANTISFGDGYNDIDMLRATGIGYAMDNAPDEVKAAADHITLDNGRNGVLHILEQL